MEMQKQLQNSGQRYASLIRVLNHAKDKQTAIAAEVAGLRKQLEQNKAGVPTTGKAGELSREINTLKILTGELAVQGPGLSVTLDDRQATATKIFSGDIKDIINILRYSGAEAISINGQRVVNNTAVHEAGRNLLVNRAPINRQQGIPYEILAIGDQDNMESYLKVTYGLFTDLQAAGVKIDISRADRVEIPAYKGGMVFKYGRP